MSIEEVERASIESLDKLFDAFSHAQGEFTVPKKTKTATVRGVNKAGRQFEYSYKYSTLDDLIEATRPALSKYGLACYQDPTTDGPRVAVSTIIAHKSGQVWRSKPLTLIAETNDPQKIGSALAYARRYSMSASLGVASQDDDDAETAGEPSKHGNPEQRSVQHPEPASGSSSAARAPKPDEKKQDAPKADEKKVGRGDNAAYPGCVNVKQVKRLFTIAQNHNVTNTAIKSFLNDGGIPSTDRIPLDKYDGIILAIQNGHVTEDETAK